MQPTSRWKIFHLSYLSNPSSDRIIYKSILQKKSHYILELGIGDGKRALRMIDAAARFTDRSNIQYIGMDSFEDRSEADGPGLPFIDAHRLLGRSGAKIKLFPGDPLRSLTRSANDLGQVDVLIISPQFDTERLNKVWYFVPRLLHAQTQIFVEQKQSGGKHSIQVVSTREIEQWANKAIRWKAA